MDAHVRDRALSPAESFIVQAPAGSGKTTLLVRRYLNLLARVDQPEEILAITFTRKAATEMRERILDHRLNPESLEGQQARTRNRTSNWGLDRNPSRLRIQTIDSFIMGLLRVLPLTSGFNRDAVIPEDMTSAYRQAVESVLHHLYNEHPLNVYVADFLALFGNDADRASEHLIDMLGHRDQWLILTTDVLKQASGDRTRLQRTISSAVQHLCSKLISEVENSFDAEQTRIVSQLTQEFWPDEPESLQKLATVLTTSTGKLRKRLTVREGFGPDRKAAKTSAQKLIDSLRDGDMETVFANLRFLPDKLLSQQELDILATVSVTLTLAALALVEQFQQNGQTDFIELLLSAHRALGEEQAPSDLALLLDYRLQQILVDEFQDTSASQFALFEMLVRGWSPDDGRTFFAVGDPMQSIYKFRDADMGLFYRAQNHGISDVALSQLILQTNFRSSAYILDWFNTTFGSIMGQHDNPHLGKVRYHPATSAQIDTSADPDQVIVRLSHEVNTEIAILIRDLQRLRREQPMHTIGILVRSRQHLAQLIATLKTTDLEWQASDIDPLARTPIVKDLVSLLTAFSDRSDRLAWFSLLRCPWVGCNLKDLEILSQCRQFNRQAITDRLSHLSLDGQQRVARLMDVMEQHDPHRYSASARSLIESMWLKLGGAHAYRDPASATYADQFFTLIDQSGIQGLLPERVTALLGSLFAESGLRKHIQIMTIHKAKGLEFDHVFLPFLDRETATTTSPLLHWRFFDGHLLIAAKDSGTLYDWLNREARQQEHHELQRLLYVACSRAKRSLTLSASTGGTDPQAQFRPHPQTLAAMVASRFTVTVNETAALIPTRSEHAERLPASYQFLPAAEFMVAPFSDDTVTAEIVAPTRLHQLLARMANLDAAARAELIAEHPDADEKQMLTRIISDDRGEWILKKRASAEENVVLAALDDDGRIKQILLDRTFVEDADRWVIQYIHTPVSAADIDDLVKEILRDELSQSGKIRDVVHNFYGDTTRMGLYFTAVPGFVELWGRSGAVGSDPMPV